MSDRVGSPARTPAGSPLDGTAADAEERHVPASDGGSIHCVVAGAGPTVLLAHGFLLDLSLFQPVFAQLVSRGCRVVAFDQRGHGDTRAGSAGCSPAAAVEDYRVLLDHFGVDGATLVGHSMGGFLSLLYCMQHPQHARRLRRLVLLGANAGAVAEGSLANRIQMPLLESGLLPKLWRMPTLGRALMKPLFGDAPKPEWLERTRNMLISQDVPQTLQLMRAMAQEDHYAGLRAIDVDARVLCGDKDRTCPAWHSKRLGAELPRAQNRWLPGMGHMLAFEGPAAILSAILDH